MKLSLTNNFNRDLFVLITRTCAAHSCSESSGINPEIVAEEVDLKLVKTEKLGHIVEPAETMVED